MLCCVYSVIDVVCACAALSLSPLFKKKTKPWTHTHTNKQPLTKTLTKQNLKKGVLLDIAAMILIVVEENLPFGVLWTPWSDLFYALMFWAVFLLVLYCLFFCFL